MIGVQAVLLVISSQAAWEAVSQNVITDRPPVQVFPNGTFDESVLPMLTEQARQVLPYVMHKAGIADDKLPTFWMAADDEPRFALEQAVVRIAELDFPEGLKAAGVAGMEWWCQVSESGEGSGTMHFDKDEGAASLQQKMIMAMRSTVTYLTDVGTPTAVFNARYRPGPVFENEEIATEGWIVSPKRNKHISFQGDLYHGIFRHIYPNPNRARALRATLLVNYWAFQPLEPYCVPMPLQSANDFPKMPTSVKHPEHPNGPYPSAIEEMDMSPELLQRSSLPCDTGIREDFVWMPRKPPAKGSTMHLKWPKSHLTERKFYHVRRSRFAGDPLPPPGTEQALERGGAQLPYDTADADADHTGRAIELAESGDMAAAISSFRAASRFTPTAAEVWVNLGMALLDEDNKERTRAMRAEAAKSFEMALMIDPNNDEAHDNLRGLKDEYRHEEL